MGRPAATPKRDNAADLGSVGVGHRAEPASQIDPDPKEPQAAAAAHAANGQSAAVFGMSERRVPRMFSQSVALPGGAEPSGSGSAATNSRDPADDAAMDGEYSPTSDPRLGPFARPPADRAPSTPDRCTLKPSAKLIVHLEQQISLSAVTHLVCPAEETQAVFPRLASGLLVAIAVAC